MTGVNDLLELTPRQAQSRMSDRPASKLVDVREPEELAAAHIQDAELIPMRSIPGELQRLEALADEGDLLVLCHHGVRSLQVVSWLRGQGIENCFSVTGGIDRWSTEIDPEIPRY